MQFFFFFLFFFYTARPSVSSQRNLRQREGHPGTWQVETPPRLWEAFLRHKSLTELTEFTFKSGRRYQTVNRGSELNLLHLTKVVQHVRNAWWHPLKGESKFMNFSFCFEKKSFTECERISSRTPSPKCLFIPALLYSPWSHWHDTELPLNPV